MNLIDCRLRNWPRKENPNRPFWLIEDSPWQCANRLYPDLSVILLRLDNINREIDRKISRRSLNKPHKGVFKPIRARIDVHSLPIANRVGLRPCRDKGIFLQAINKPPLSRPLGEQPI